MSLEERCGYCGSVAVLTLSGWRCTNKSCRGYGPKAPPPQGRIKVPERKRIERPGLVLPAGHTQGGKE